MSVKLMKKDMEPKRMAKKLVSICPRMKGSAFDELLKQQDKYLGDNSVFKEEFKASVLKYEYQVELYKIWDRDPNEDGVMYEFLDEICLLINRYFEKNRDLMLELILADIKRNLKEISGPDETDSDDYYRKYKTSDGETMNKLLKDLAICIII